VENLQTNNAFESHFLQVFDIYRRNWSQERFDLSAADSTTLLFIAASDPSVAGEAVWMARDMLRLPPFFTAMNAQRQMPEQQTEKNEAQYLVYPNPSNGLITVEVVMGSSPEYFFEVYNLNGRKVFTANAQESYDLGNLEPGVYLYQIVPFAGCVQSGKLVIIE
jgi:hypothetical protein